MKSELMKNWYVVQNGRQIDVHVKDITEGREITVVADVRNEECAALIANAPKYKEALEQIVRSLQLGDGESCDPRASQMHDLAASSLGLKAESEDQK